MARKKWLAGLGLGVGGTILYRQRWQLLARFLGLPAKRQPVKVTRHLRLPMADGVNLVTDHYMPVGAGSYPTLLIRSPYGCGREVGWFGLFYEGFSRIIAERGYNVVLQTVRGRCESEGEFDMCVNEAADGMATLQWLAEQPWFNGKLGLWGPSYPGYAVWALAAQNPPYLSAIVPSFSSTGFHRPFFKDGLVALDAIQQAILLLRYDTPQSRGRITPRDVLHQNLPPQRARAKAAIFHLPLSEFDVAVSGQPLPAVQKWLSDSLTDENYWQQLDHSPRVGNISAPAHLISGWYDIFLPGALADYAALKAREHTATRLTIGPWSHIDLGVISESVSSGYRWFEEHLKGKPPQVQAAPVKLYIMGVKKWRNYSAWPPPSRTTPYYLHSDKSLSTKSAVLAAPPSRYRYDPANPTPSIGGAMFSLEAGAKDNRRIEKRADVLCFSTERLTAPLEIIGTVCLELYVRSSLAYTDFFGRLCDVSPTGRSTNICDGIVRLAPGKGELQPDGSLRLCVEFNPTAYQFKRGHRLRLQVSSGAHPLWNRNLGTGEPPIRATRMLAADQTVYHDRLHPSALILPVTNS